MDIPALEGRTFGPYPMRICVEKVAEFVALSSDDPVRWIDAAPPGYVAAALFVVAPDLLAQLAGYSVIHGDQSFEWYSELTMEENFEISGRVSRVRERGETYFVTFTFDMALGEKKVASGNSLFLMTAKTEEPTGPDSPIVPSQGVDDVGPVQPRQKSASRSDLVRYAAATRDWNPIHWDHGAAVAAGLDGVVVHGLLQAAWALEAACRNSEANRPLAKARLRFRSPLSPGIPVDVLSEESESGYSVVISDESTTYLTASIEASGE